MDCSQTVFVDEFSNFSTFSAALLVLGLPERSSISADTLPALKRECHLETTVRLKECSPKASRSISSVPVVNLPSFNQNIIQTLCSLLSFTADKKKHEFEKTLV
jgi:hypothetical protein